jgi:heat shock protein HtpX
MVMTEAVGGPVRADIVRTTNVAYVAAAVVIALVVTLITWPSGLGVWSIALGVIVGAGVAALAFLRGDQLALSALGAERLEPGRYPQLDNIVEGLVVSNGFRMPTLYVVDDAAPNAFVVGRTARHGALAVTTGLVESLRRIELEGVLAHELSRIRSGETRAGVTAATLICRPLGFTGGFAESLAARLVDPAAGVRSDLAGVALTRYPPGLAAALAKLEADGRTVARNPRAYRHLWIDPPADAIAGAQFSISDRVEVLTEL